MALARLVGLATLVARAVARTVVLLAVLGGRSMACLRPPLVVQLLMYAALAGTDRRRCRSSRTSLTANKWGGLPSLHPPLLGRRSLPETLAFPLPLLLRLPPLLLLARPHCFIGT